MAGSGPGGEPGTPGDNGDAPERTGEDIPQGAVRRRPYRPRPFKDPDRQRRLLELTIMDERERYASALAKAAYDSPREVAGIYLKLALPDVLQSLVRKAMGNGGSSVSAARVICDLLGVREARRAVKQPIIDPVSEEQEAKDVAELTSIRAEIGEG